jgi:hypothetical protein
MTKQKIALLALLATLFVGCKDDEQNYRYIVTNKTTIEDSLTVTYRIEGETTTREKKLVQGDSIVIARRSEVSGKGVWDIETSVVLYKIPELKVNNQDLSRISEDLAFRKLWKGPTEVDGIGIYQLDITDERLALTLQKDYIYMIKNELEDTIFSTSHLKLVSGENTTRSADTILAGERKSIGSVDIYTYGEEHIGEPRYKTQKMSGLSTIFFLYKEGRVEINLSKDTTHFETGKDTCTLIVSERMQKVDEILHPTTKKK